jgi:ATP-dependent Clp protease adaptor protein ClpS
MTQTAEPDVQTTSKVDRLTPWKVVLLNDDYHSYDYVMAIFVVLFQKTVEEAYALTVKVDRDGSAIAKVCSKERAELYYEQVRDFGPDPHWKGKVKEFPLGCTIEPA